MIPFSERLIVDGFGQLDGFYLSPEGQPWESVDAFIAFLDDELIDIVPYTTILVKQADGSSKEMINSDEAEPTTFVAKGGGSSVELDTEVPAVATDDKAMSTKLSLAELAKKEDKLVLGYGVKKNADGTLTVDPDKCIELEAEVDGESAPRIFKLFAFEI